jgi:hypothetical protein
MTSLEQAIDELMWPSITIDSNTSMRDRYDMFEWCSDTFGAADFCMVKNRLYFRQEKYITLFRIRWA